MENLHAKSSENAVMKWIVISRGIKEKFHDQNGMIRRRLTPKTNANTSNLSTPHLRMSEIVNASTPGTVTARSSTPDTIQ